MALTGVDALVTLARVKTELGITVSTYDTELEEMIRGATDAIKRHCRHGLTRATVTDERHRARGGVELYLRRTPVVSITSITLDDDTVDTDYYELVDPASGLVYWDTPMAGQMPRRSGIAQRRVPRYAEPDYKVTYVAGWITAQQETDAVGTRDLPWDIERAALALVSYYWGTKGAVGEIASEKLGDASVSYFKAGAGNDKTASISNLPSNVASILSRYRRPGIV